MTEDEARTKWCPMARVGQLASTGINIVAREDADYYKHNLCMASDCMMWVEDTAPPITNSNHGHCGLAK